MRLNVLVGLAPSLVLETSRLILRRMQAADEATALAHEQDRRIMRWIRDPQPLAAMRERFAAMLDAWNGDDGEWLALAVCERDQPAPCGLVVARVTQAQNETMEIGYRFAPEVHRRGYAFEAMMALGNFLFDTIEVHKLVAYCVADNEASWRLMEKLGMQREARFREYTRLDGQWRDELVYGLLRQDRLGA